jgi:Stabilization of polarity axis
MDLSAAPILTRSEKIIMRNSERKDVFIEKFTSPRASSEAPQHLKGKGNHRPMNSTGSHSSFDEGIIFRHNRPAGQVSSYVLSACALGSGCGIILRGFIERAFPYATLINRDEWESV